MTVGIHYTEEGPVYEAGLRMYNSDGTVSLGNECCTDRCDCCEQDRSEHWSSIAVEFVNIESCTGTPSFPHDLGNCAPCEDWINVEWQLDNMHDHSDDTEWCNYEWIEDPSCSYMGESPGEVFRWMKSKIGGYSDFWGRGDGDIEVMYYYVTGGAPMAWPMREKKGIWCNIGDRINNNSCPCPNEIDYDYHDGCNGYAELTGLNT